MLMYFQKKDKFSLFKKDDLKDYTKFKKFLMTLKNSMVLMNIIYEI